MMDTSRDFKRGFGSDNHSAVHPLIFKAIENVNIGHAPSYGTDPVSQDAEAEFKKHFGPKSQTFFVFNGTAANVIALRALTASYQAVVASDQSHLQMDECGAPEFFTGAKLLLCGTNQGKILPEEMLKHFIRWGDQHYSQPKVLSLTQPTELGTVYSLEEIKNLIQLAKAKGLFIHMDGARIANAALHLGKKFSEFTTDLGVDIVSFGGTKNGLMYGEAVVCLNAEAAKSMKFLRKQSAQLPSKTRYVAAQFLAYFQNDLWQEIATHSCSMATYFRIELSKIPGIQFLSPTQSNGIFVYLPKPIIKKLKEKFFFYVWDEKTFSCRLMTTWDTQRSDIDDFITELKLLMKDHLE
ncbi:MAG: threonine aldolase family protein [Pseudobdellovibrionaceae bacterium]